MVAISDGWRQFYESAQQQDAVDPGLVTAIAVSESGWSANGGLSGPINLGIDSNGTPGLPGVASGVGNSTHRFYTYRSGLEAAQGLAGYWNTPLYGGSGIWGSAPEGQAQIMVGKGYSGCPGPECDAQWGNKILSIRSQIVGAFGPSTSRPAPGNIAVPGGGQSASPGATPQPGSIASGGDIAAPAASAASAVGNAVSAVGSGVGGLVDAANHILADLRTPGFWWTILLFAAGLAAIVAGGLAYFKGASLTGARG